MFETCYNTHTNLTRLYLKLSHRNIQLSDNFLNNFSCQKPGWFGLALMTKQVKEITFCNHPRSKPTTSTGARTSLLENPRTASTCGSDRLSGTIGPAPTWQMFPLSVKEFFTDFSRHGWRKSWQNVN